MGTVENGSEVPPDEGSLPSQGNASVQGTEQEGKELREVSGVSEKVVTENGVVVSGCGNRDFGGDGVVEVVKSSVIETTEVSVSGLGGSDSKGLADSEMNGVSSLLKMRKSGRSAQKLDCAIGEGGEERSHGRKSEEEIIGEDHDGKNVIVDVPIVETSETMDVEEVEDLSDEGYGFSVGDFVWGKIKSHPWWPGRVYDPSDASDYALKLKQKNRRLLVAYFGDGTFAWCHPSQLKPFKEKFGDMVKQSGSRSFVNAVQEAVNEVGRLLGMKMSSSFVANKTRFGLTPPRAKNAGIKERVLVPEDGIERLSAVAFEPPELLSQVKQAAEIAIASILELEILKAQLSAFNLSRGGYELTHYEDPQPVPGLEDSLVDEMVDVGNDGKSAVEVPVQRPFEVCHSPGLSGNRSSNRRKQKSIAEIMGKDKDVYTKNKEGDATDKVMETIGSRSTTGRKRRKDSEDTMTLKQIQRRKALLRDTNGNVPNADNGSGSGKEHGNKDTESKEMKEATASENISDGSKKETDEAKTREQDDKDSLPSPRERRRSKYLSPPFTAPIRVPRKGDAEGRASERTPRAASQPSSRVLKSNGEASRENFPKEVAVEWELSDGSNHQTQDEEKKTIDLQKIQAPPSKVLSEFRHAAISPQMLRDNASLGTFVDFISVYRSSLYCEGSLYKVYKKSKPGRKRKKLENDDKGMLKKEQDQQLDPVSPNHDSGRSKRRKRDATTPSMSNVKKGKDEKASSAAALFVSFWPGSSLPSKSDLVGIYSKFGALKESETDMFRTNYTARVCFLRASDAEKALKHSQDKNPFGSSEVSFELKYLSDDESNKNSAEHGERSKSKLSQAKQAKKKEKTSTLEATTTTTSPSSEASKLKFVREKLQGLTSMLESSDGNEPDVKNKVVSEMKGLLEDVDKMQL